MLMKTLNFTLLFTIMTASVFSYQNKNTLRFRLQSVSTSYLDETTIFFDDNISPLYNSSEDAAKIFNKVPGVPAIFSYTSDNIQCSTNGFGNLTSTEIIPLGYRVDVSGNYKI